MEIRFPGRFHNLVCTLRPTFEKRFSGVKVQSRAQKVGVGCNGMLRHSLATLEGEQDFIFALVHAALTTGVCKVVKLCKCPFFIILLIFEGIVNYNSLIY